MIYQRSWGCFVAFYGAVFIVLGFVLGDEVGIFIDVLGFVMVAVGIALFVTYYVKNPPG